MKILVGVDLGAYSFNATSKTVTLTGLDILTLDQLLLITNVTDNKIIYQFNKPGYGASITNNVITLDFDTSQMQDDDVLQIFVEYSNQTNKVITVDQSLTAGDTYTGDWINLLDYASVLAALKTTVNLTWYIQLSQDAITVDSTLTRYYRTNQIEAPHKFSRTREWGRVVVYNDSASDTIIRLQTIFGNTEDLNIPTDSVVAQDYDAKIVRPTNFNYEVALGRRQGFTTWNKFGYNVDVDAAATEAVASFGGTFTPLTTASTLTIVSSSTNDDGSPAGTGANSIVITGVDANRIAQTEVVTLNGTTSVVTSTTWLGINRAAIYLAGSGLTNAGTITITATTGGTTQGQIPIGEGTTQQSIFFTQDNHQFLSDFLRVNVEKTGGGATPKVRIKGWVFSAVANSKYLVFNELIDTSAQGFDSIAPTQPFVIGEKSCLWFEATTDTNDTFVSVRFSGIEVRDVNA
jgi:hypothetical protein